LIYSPWVIWYSY